MPRIVWTWFPIWDYRVNFTFNLLLSRRRSSVATIFFFLGFISRDRYQYHHRNRWYYHRAHTTGTKSSATLSLCTRMNNQNEEEGEGEGERRKKSKIDWYQFEQFKAFTGHLFHHFILSFFHSFAPLATDYTILDVCSGSQIKRSIYRWIMIIPWMIRWSVSIAYRSMQNHSEWFISILWQHDDDSFIRILCQKYVLFSLNFVCIRETEKFLIFFFFLQIIVLPFIITINSDMRTLRAGAWIPFVCATVNRL